MTQHADPGLKRWEILGLVSLLVIVVTIPLSLLRPTSPHVGTELDPTEAVFSGTASCVDCHRPQYEKWLGSDHDLAMDIADEQTVLGDFGDVEFTHAGVTSRFYRRDGGFFVWTEGPGGEMAEFEVTHVFGFEPLQQYLVPFPGGRLQALSLAWDTERHQWFHLYPGEPIAADDWLHWSRNGQNWNGMCAECHSTNLQKNFDPQTQTYATTWSDIDVGCEGCHGPGSIHLDWARIPPMGRPELRNAGLVVPTYDLSSDRLVQMCAPCHARRAELGDYDHTGLELLDHMLPSLLNEGLYHPDGQIQDEVYVYGSFLQSKMHQREVRCSDCHDSHSLKLHFTGNELCLQCHQRETYDTFDHHFHKQEFEGKPSDGALCVKCHMVEQPYMVIDWRADHSFRVPRPDLTAEIGTPNACTQIGCHDNKPLQWSIDAYVIWSGKARKPHFGTAFASARQGDPGARPQLERLVDSPLHPAIVRATALDLLAQLPGGIPSGLMDAVILDPDPLLRHMAASRLQAEDPERFTELLAPLLADPVKAVRLAALAQLALVPPESLEPYQRDHFAQVLQEYTAAMSYSMDFASSGFNLGNLHTALGDVEEAERNYRLSLAIDDRLPGVHVNLAMLLNSLGRKQEAEQHLRRAIDLDPEPAPAAYNLGLLLAEMARFEDAAVYLQIAADGMPHRPRVHFNLGLVLQKLGRGPEAATALEKAVTASGQETEFMLALADHLLRARQLTAAEVWVDRILGQDPQQPTARQMKQILEQNR